jgi:mono/diheme cytochrome c family protein
MNASSTLRTAAAGLGLAVVLLLGACKASGPGNLESQIAIEAKKMTIGYKDVKNPTPESPESVKTGAQHFQHHCQICHGLDGHKTGVPFADKMSPPVVDLGEKDVQQYTDGQLKWIIENGIRFTGMPGWKGILEEEEMWYIVRYMRNLPPAGSLGAPAVFKEEAEEHEALKGAQASGEAKPHSHGAESKPHKH